MMKRFFFVLLSAFLSFNAFAFPTFPALNKDGTVVTDVLTANYDPLNRVFPFPFNLLFLDSMDLTINAPVADPNDLSDPTVALNAIDGFSTVERWTTGFSSFTGLNGIDPASVVAGESVRVLQVTTPAPFVPYVPTGIVRELTANVDYTAAVLPGNTVAIIPLQPLPEYSTFLAVLTNDITDTAGNNATPSQTYFLTKRRTPWVDSNGNSTYPLVPDATAQSLEPQRQITQAMEGVASAVGIPPDDIVLSWTVQTQSISPTMRLLRSITEPGDTLFAPTGLNTSVIGAPGLADISIGVISLPYYLGIPDAEDPTALLDDPWRAEPGAYIPPFDQFPLDPTSENITIANPFPVLTGIQTVPLIVMTPGEASGMTKPEDGWPVVLYPSSLTRNRTDAMAFSDSMALAGFAVIGIDQPMHGVVPDVEPQLAPFYIKNTPFGAIANERTFDADLVNNTTGAPGPDGLTDPSGTHSFNLLNLQVARDNIRQASTDLSVLAVSVASMDIDNDGSPDFDADNISIVGFSAGGAAATTFAAVEPLIKRVYLNASPGSIMRTVVAGAFGVRINAALAAAGIVPGTADYEAFLTVAQTLLDPSDSINYYAETVSKVPLLFHEVIDDMTVPNTVFGAPLAGSEAAIRLMGLTSYSTTQADPDGLSHVGRFLPPAVHSTWLDPTESAATTLEMQAQAAAFMASGGTLVPVINGDVMLSVPQMQDGSQPLVVRPESGNHGLDGVTPRVLNAGKGRRK
ncbi:MAG TPA: hypothetical protein VJ984_07055 [Xanthomonadales bacterium]|nr:hypothetical protein [Xanthomonadales bacterium]